MQVLHPQSMRPAREGDIPVRVKNSYNPKAPGTLITKQREMDKVCIILLKVYSTILTSSVSLRIDFPLVSLLGCTN
jgi:aspartate kinase